MRALGVLAAVVIAAVSSRLSADPVFSSQFETITPATLAPPPTLALQPTAAEPTTTVVLPTTTVPVVPLSDADFGAFDFSLAASLRNAQAVGVAIAQNGVIVHEAGFGETTPGTADWVNPDSRFRIASNSKTITAIVILQLVEDGTIGLDEPIVGRLADYLGVEMSSRNMADITVRHLLMHRSGFGERFQVFFRSGALTCSDAARRGLAEGLSGTPGGGMQYSNMNYCMLGLIIEMLTGEAYERVVQDRLLTPLGILSMRTARTHDVQPGDVKHQSGPLRDYMEALGGAGAWIGTAEDLVLINDSLDPGKDVWHPLSDEMLLQMYATPYLGAGRGSEWYGFGLRVWGDGTWGHTGTVESSRSMVLHRPDGITWAVVVAGNTPSETDNLRFIVDRAFAEIGLPPS